MNGYDDIDFLIKKSEIEKFEQKHKKYMSNSYKIAVLPGDQNSSEVTAESVKVLNVIAQAFQYKFEFEYAKMGAEAIFETGKSFARRNLNCL